MRRLLIIGFCLSFLWIVFNKTESGRAAKIQIAQNMPEIRNTITRLPALPQLVLPSPEPAPVPIEPDTLLKAINAVRKQHQAPLLRTNQVLCPLAQKVADAETLTTKTITAACKYCDNVASLSLGTATGTESALQYITGDSTASAMLLSAKMRHICIATNVDVTGVVAASIQVPPTPKPQRVITEDELWQALVQYRHANTVSDLSRDEKLCEYARKRVNDHLQLLDQHKKQSEYPVPDKYPLDAHDGFRKDGDSGLVFEMTGKNEVAENLAYWPDAEYATHVIEWGWDSSKEGHRETQLSNDYNAGCLSGKQGFFVAIFGK